MCGICGIIYCDPQRSPDPDLLQKMTRVISHRGPDDEGYFIEGPVGLGSRRLSIVGLGDGHMPMSSEDRRVWAVYNGELYNHPILKQNLQAKGYRYRTSADTESFIHLYREYGTGFLEHTQGMFSLALWDRDRQTLILARDRLGIKPLYYHWDGKALRFGSEIKSILCDAEVPREIEPNALNYYLSYLSAPAPYSMLKGIKKLFPGEMLIYKNGRISTRPFWKPTESIHPTHESSIQAMTTELARRLRKTVEEHLLSDVPVGAFLSGGIDSSILVAIMREYLGAGIKTFSIGFEGHSLFDETPHARQIAKQFQTDHYEEILSPENLLDAIDDITWQLDEPLADSSCLPVYFVSKLAARHVKVVLSGDGGDEVFAGYRKYQAEYFRRYLSWLPEPVLRFIARSLVSRLPESRSGYWMDLSRQINKFFRGLDPDPFERHLKWAIHFDDASRGSLLNPDVLETIDFDEPYRFRQRLFSELEDTCDLNRMLWVDLRHGLPADMLMKVDRISMLHSLEVRVPFLDHKLVEYGFSLPGDVKLRGKTTKWVLKEAFADILPPDIIHRRKHGFDVPVGEWFKHELRDRIEEVCSEAAVNRRGLFNPRQVRQIVLDHQDGIRDYNNQLWMLFSLENWQRLYLDSPPGYIPPRPA